MSVTLNDDLARAIDAQGDVPLRAIHPQTGKAFFLLSEEQYQRLKPLFEIDPLSREEQQILLRHAGRRAGWDDPEMEAYDHYDENRS
jgi:hypothetical protein